MSSLIGTRSFRHDRPASCQAMETDESISRRASRALRAPAAPLSSRKHPLFLRSQLLGEIHSLGQPSKITSKDRAEIEAALEARNLTPEQRAKVEGRSKHGEHVARSGRHHAAKRRDTTPEETDTPQATPTSKETAPPLTDSSPAFFQSGNPSTPFEKWIETRAKEKIGEHGTNLQLFLKTLISNLPYMMLCCIPLFALVLKILYIRRKNLLYRSPRLRAAQPIVSPTSQSS